MPAKLYYTSTSCGAASFIAAFTAGVNIQTEQVDIKTHKLANGTDFHTINPKGNVPALVLEDGTVLNEGAAVLQWIADQQPGRVAPPNGTTGRYLVQNALNYVASEVHTSIGGLFNPTLHDEVKAAYRARAALKIKYLEEHFIGDKAFVVGDSFTIADSYLYIVLTWTKYLGVDLTPKVAAYVTRIAALDNVVKAHARIATNPATSI